jgi:predicted Fe-Mo cluster-binding NifX family protein
VTAKEFKMLKIAITSEGPPLEDLIDPRFGRAAGFIIIDPISLKFEYVLNGEAQVRDQGAGIQAAETVARQGVTAVLTGYVGPKAFQALAAAGIQVAQDLENITVREALDRYNQGVVTWAQPADAKGRRP